MKQALAILLIIFTSYSIEVIRPPFIVENEPIPPAVTMSYSYGSNQYHDQSVDLYPGTIGKTERFLLFPNIGFAAEQYPSIDTLPELFSGVYAGFMGTGKIGDGFVWQSYHSAGVFGDSFESIKKDIKYFQLSLLGYKLRPNFLLSAGVLINSKMGNPVYVPVLRFSYASPSIVLEGVLPVQGSVRWMASENFHLVLNGRYCVNNFKSETFDSIVESARFETLITGERRIKGWLWGTVGAGYAGKTKFSLASDTDLGEIKSGFRMKAAIILRPQIKASVTETPEM